LSEEFGPIGNNSTGECAGREIIAWFARQLEASIHEPRRATLDVVRRALEGAGVEFIDENGGGAGVRLRKPEKRT
jgi:hypothetical protein